MAISSCQAEKLFLAFITKLGGGGGGPVAGTCLLFTALLSCGVQLGQGLIMQPLQVSLLASVTICIIGVKKFSGLSLASPGSAEVFHLIAKWMNLEVCIHILLLAA